MIQKFDYVQVLGYATTNNIAQIVEINMNRDDGEYYFVCFDPEPDWPYPAPTYREDQLRLVEEIPLEEWPLVMGQNPKWAHQLALIWKLCK